MIIGLLGLTFGENGKGHPNKGCEALTYSFLEILNILAKKENKIYEVKLLCPISPKK